MRRPRRVPVASLAVSLTTLWIAGCSAGGEEALIRQFFTASRLRDNGTLAGFAAAEFDPRVQGSVTSFEVVSMSEERRTPITLKALASEVEKAEAEDVAFTERKLKFQNENLDAITRVLKLEAAGGSIAKQDAAVQAAWTKWRDDTAEHSRQVAEAKRQLSLATDLVALSASSPRRPVDVTQYDGEWVAKDVTVRAPVELPDGSTQEKTLVITLQRAELNGEEPIEGRWLITRVSEAGAGG